MNLMEPPMELRVYGEEDFFDDQLLYDNFLKKLRRKVKKKGLFKSVVSMGAPSLLIKKALLKKAKRAKKSAPEPVVKQPVKKAVKKAPVAPHKSRPAETIQKTERRAHKATPKPEQVRPVMKQQLVKSTSPNAVSQSRTGDKILSEDKATGDQAAEPDKKNKLLVIIAVVAGVVVLVKVVQHYKQQPVG